MNDLINLMRTLDQSGTHVTVDESVNTGGRRNSEDRFWIRVVADAVSDYLGGLGEKINFNWVEREDAKRWIFHSHPRDDIGFDQKWKDLFPHIDLDVVKKELKKRYKERKKRFDNGNKDKSVCGRKEDTLSCGDDPGERSAKNVEARVGFEYFIFG